MKYIAQIKVDIPAVPKIDLTTQVIGTILSTVFIVVGALAVLFLLVGAVRYVTSQGDQAMLTQAKNTIFYALIGVIASASAFAIVQLIVGTLSV